MLWVAWDRDKFRRGDLPTTKHSTSRMHACETVLDTGRESTMVCGIRHAVHLECHSVGDDTLTLDIIGFEDCEMFCQKCARRLLARGEVKPYQFSVRPPRYTLTTARAQLRKIRITLDKRDGEYRVNFLGGEERTAYYTTDLEDAVATGEHMDAHGGGGSR